MSTRADTWSPAPDGPPSRRRFLVASLACHAVLLGLLYRAVPYRVQQERHADERVRVEQSLERTAHKEMQRRVRTMADIKDLLEQSAGQRDGEGAPAKDKAGGGKPPSKQQPQPPSKPQPLSPRPDALLAKAKELAAAIQATEKRIKAAELAKLLRIPEKQALAKVRADDAKRARLAAPLATPLPREAAVAQLEAQAKAALARRQRQLARAGAGVAVHGAAGPGGQGPGIGGAIDALLSGMGIGNRYVLREGSVDMTSGGLAEQRNYGALVTPPALDLARLRTGAGRKLGPGGPYANRIFINNWYIIGPFLGASADSLDEIYPPERAVDLDAVYFGKSGELLKWRWQGDTNYPAVPAPPAQNAVYYAYTQVDLDRERDLWLSIGADDDAKLWFNDRLVWVSGDQDKPWYRTPFYALRNDIAQLNLTDGRRKLRFHKGRNTILVKLYNGAGIMFFSVVLAPEADGASR